MEGSGMNLPDAGERGDADGFGGDDRVPGLCPGPGGGAREAVPGFDSGSFGRLNVYYVRGERGTDKDAGDGIPGRREQGHGDRDGSGGR